MKNRIVLLGPPASGKGTQASLLGAAFGIPHASTGAILREERAKETPLGIEADSYVSRGLLFPDEVALRVVEHWMAGRTRFLFDGFPRTIGQAVAFDALLSDRSIPLDAVYLFLVTEEEIRDRILGRLTCVSCGSVFNEKFHGIDDGTPCPQCSGGLGRRSDDNEESLSRRLLQYETHTRPLIDYYRKSGILKDVDVSAGRDAVFKLLYDDIKEAA